MKRYVFLDIDDTIIDFNESARQSIIHSFNDWNLPYSEAVFSAFVPINDVLWHQLERKEITKQKLFLIRWDTIFKALHMSVDGPAFEKTFLSYLYDIAIPVSGAYELLEYLSSRYTICLTSNAPYQQQKNRLKNANMLMYANHMYMSERIGFAKPHPSFFQFVMDDLHISNKEDIVVIGDSYPADIVGGSQFGLDTIWFCRKDRQDKENNIQPTYTVHSLREIESIL